MNDSGIPREWRWPALSAGVAAGLIVAVIVAAVGWIPNPFADDDSADLPDGVSGLVGGCERFTVFSQNRWPPLGASKRAEPSPTADKVGSFAPNEVIPVDGWVRTRSSNPANTPPWNSDVWFHVADNSGWVWFGAVRADPTVPDETGGFSEDGGRPAPTDPDCSGSIR